MTIDKNNNKMLVTDDEFLSSDLFIRLSWSIYFNSSSLIETQYYKDLENLISTTCLNKVTLIHTLYYLYLLVNHKPFLYQSSNYKLSSFQSSSRIKLLSNSNRKSSKELYELIVILFMISNKANDDSSYTMKTWSNLTPLTNSILKKKELVVLKKIQYNVFLKNDEYLKWCNQLYQIGLNYGFIYQSSPLSSNSYHVQPVQPVQLVQQIQPQNFTYTQPTQTQIQTYPLTPKSPIQDVSYQLPLPSMIPQQVSQPQPQPQVVQQQYSIPQSTKRSISQEYHSSPYKKLHHDNTPSKTKPFNCSALNKPNLNSYKYNSNSRSNSNPNSNLLLTPIKTNQYDYQNLYDQSSNNNIFNNNGYQNQYTSENYNPNYYMNNYQQTQSQLPQQSQYQYQYQYQPQPQQSIQYPIYGYQTQFPHPPNCPCCQLTNYTNSYHSSLKSMIKL
ncbi:hypothetical protein BN7_5537 [Wickerhamomyces ciferrii]|uniref:Cyclin N-terminal domain-containing protein n=1 Tax=Wickerhamomyces ciferrii (strain ATCC 14091 / BCRC 22168 / CBS 111 / JCM 3599 / NBRC 0793 / NRRL Y-1031 F-60-10) TaxID=1206466 RepID=K0KL36_WICCF|nr:uncharacterized protein BN7_5537 [Wickerhamomyces ciferrii]CCH45950.1 hypothetical protein BN7_5537 [Wickerhamomyces ciferrii]